jgi:cyclase
VVKGVHFLSLRDAGDPVELGAYYEAEGADELVFLDIDASFEGRATMVEVVRRCAESVFIPLTVGGGIESVASAEALLRAGADKVSINSSAVGRPQLISELAQRFGRQCVVLAVDARRRRDRYVVVTHGGRRETQLDVVDWVRTATELGAGEILLTAMDRDGTKDGYDLELLKLVSSAVSVPIIASGGVGTRADFVDGVQIGGAQGLLAASVFHFGEISIASVKASLRDAGISVRLNVHPAPDFRN